MRGERNTTEKHKKRWSSTAGAAISRLIFSTPRAGPELPVPNGAVIRKNYVGKDIENYDSMLVLSHFKGAPDGRLRRRAQAAFDRRRVVVRQGVISTVRVIG